MKRQTQGTKSYKHRLLVFALSGRRRSGYCRGGLLDLMRVLLLLGDEIDLESDGSGDLDGLDAPPRRLVALLHVRDVLGGHVREVGQLLVEGRGLGAPLVDGALGRVHPAPEGAQLGAA